MIVIVVLNYFKIKNIILYVKNRYINIYIIYLQY